MATTTRRSVYAVLECIGCNPHTRTSLPDSLLTLSFSPPPRLRDVMTTMTGRSVYLVLECMECNLRTYLDNAAPDVATIKVFARIFVCVGGGMCGERMC
eukprot:361744-Chlamydomonas_euryale.AAC.4